MATDTTDLQQRRDAVKAKLAALSEQLADAEQDLEQAQAEYRATTDGMAQCLRSIERAQMTPGTPDGDVRRLTKLLMEAEVRAARSYEERTRRWGHRDGDGHLFACPMGGDKHFQRICVSADILGTYLVDPTIPEGEHDTFTVRLSVPVGERLRRSRLTVPADLRRSGALSLYDVFRHGWNSPKQEAVLARFFGPDLDDALRSIALT